MLRSQPTVVVFACLPFAPPPPPRHSRHRDPVYFSYAAPTPEPGCFRAGLVSRDGLWRSTPCLRWVRSLQAAELWAAVGAMRIAVNRGERRICLGLDSEGARQILGRGTSAGHCVPQQLTLRRMFWLRGWSGLQVNVFRVPSANNPANPPSRLPSLASRAVSVRNARCLPGQVAAPWPHAANDPPAGLSLATTAVRQPSLPTLREQV